MANHFISENAIKLVFYTYILSLSVKIARSFLLSQLNTMIIINSVETVKEVVNNTEEYFIFF